jgi:N-acetylglucosaminyldiphosphoundecaprenol N-acetyl-beta-D-mannosaminyltransferase
MRSFHILGVRVDAVQIPDAVAHLRSWIDSRPSVSRFVAVTGMHGIAESRKSDNFKEILNAADLVVPDGMPLVWLGRTKGFELRRRVTGSELMDNFCRESGGTYRHFFYGGAQGVAEELAHVMQKKYGIVVAGTYTPPFRPLTEKEEKDFVSRVDDASPDILWVGLGTPKQERWMYEHSSTLKVPVMLGVGAAFDMNTGRLRRAPEWMREHGLEWFFRLLCEPRRLWRRYLITIPKAAWFVCMELINIAMRSNRAQSAAAVNPSEE